MKTPAAKACASSRVPEAADASWMGITGSHNGSPLGMPLEASMVSLPRASLLPKIMPDVAYTTRGGTYKEISFAVSGDESTHDHFFETNTLRV